MAHVYVAMQEEKKQEVEGVCNPIMTKMYSQGGTPGESPIPPGEYDNRVCSLRLFVFEDYMMFPCQWLVV